jgi:hypothetical protein
VAAILKIASVAVGLASLSVDGGAAAEGPMKIGVSDLASARIEGETSLAAKDAAAHGDISVVVTVDVDGRVIDVGVDENFDKLNPAPALAAVRPWRFRPQSFDGKPVVAVGVVKIAYRRPEEPAAASPPFPDAPLADTEIILERSACYGSCPDYAVSVRGDETVRFSTGGAAFKGTAGAVHLAYRGNNLLLPGTHVAHVDPAAVAALVARFRKARFFGLKRSYAALVTDNPTYKHTLRAGRKSKTVVDYVGTQAGMPEEVSALEEAVDDVAGTARWISGNIDTVKTLEAEHFDFRSEAAAELAATAMQLSLPRRRGSGREADGLILALIDRGAPLGTVPRIERSQMRDGNSAGMTGSYGALLADYAAIGGDEMLFAVLEGRGWVARLPRALMTQALADGAGCSPAIARSLVRAGAELSIKGKGTALTPIRSGYGACSDAAEERMLELAETAIGLGVPLEGRDDSDRTALMGCDSPVLARLLLSRGADANARDAEGNTPLLTTDDDRVALILLRAGADPTARTAETSLRAQASKRHMPATLAWLEAHGVK